MHACRSTLEDPTVLLVDDQADVRRLYKDVLENDGFSVVCASGVSEALAAASQSKPDVVLTDVSMPDGGGLDLCARLKADPKTKAIPVIMWSGVQKSEQDQLEGLEHGADDYLAKGTAPRLLAAKIRTLLKRFEAPQELRDTLSARGLKLDVHARTVTSKGKRVDLTRKEFDLLTVFLRKPGQVLSVNYLLETVWNYDPADYNDPRTVQTHVSALRRKLGGPLADALTSVPGLGYRFEA